MALGKKTGGRQIGSKNKTPDEFKASCRELTPAVIDLWEKTLTDPSAPPQFRFIAAERLAEYGHGKPTQAIEQHNTGELKITWVNDWRDKHKGEK